MLLTLHRMKNFTTCLLAGTVFAGTSVGSGTKSQSLSDPLYFQIFLTEENERPESAHSARHTLKERFLESKGFRRNPELG